MTRRRLAFLSLLIVILTVFVWATSGPSKPKANPPGTFSFAVLGDAPYYFWEDLQYAIVLKELDANDLSLVIQVGDIFWRPCTDKLYRRSLDWYSGFAVGRLGARDDHARRRRAVRFRIQRRSALEVLVRTS